MAVRGVAERLVYRPALVRALAVGYLLFAGWWLAAALAGDDPQHGLRLVPGLSSGAVMVHLLFWRPAVVVDGTGVLLCNVLRDVRVPWAALEAVDTRFALTLVVGDGGRHQSWAAAAPGRPSIMPITGRSGTAQTDDGHRLPDPRWSPGEPAGGRASQDLRADSGAAAFMVRQGWASWQRDQAGIRRPADQQGSSTANAADTANTATVTVSWNVWPLSVLAVALALTAVMQVL